MNEPRINPTDERDDEFDDAPEEEHEDPRDEIERTIEEVLLDRLIDVLTEEGIPLKPGARIVSFEEGGYLTTDRGVVFPVENNRIEVQLTIKTRPR